MSWHGHLASWAHRESAIAWSHTEEDSIAKQEREEGRSSGRGGRGYRERGVHFSAVHLSLSIAIYLLWFVWGQAAYQTQIDSWHGSDSVHPSPLKVLSPPAPLLLLCTGYVAAAPAQGRTMYVKWLTSCTVRVFSRCWLRFRLATIHKGTYEAVPMLRMWREEIEKD